MSWQVDKCRQGELAHEPNVPKCKQFIDKETYFEKRAILGLHDCPVKPLGQIQ